ncbi:MAG: D-amino acid dehydrogenase [Terriglobales bacterium]
MRILIIGAGVIGLTSAYVLRRRGHHVTVVDRAEGPGRETSFANGALLTPGMPEPWNAPGSWKTLLGSIARADAPLQLRLHALPNLLAWGFTFLKHSRKSLYERNTASNLRLALYSLTVMRTLRETERIEYGRVAIGALRIFRDAGAFSTARTAAQRLVAAGLGAEELSADETIDLEPALAPIKGSLTGTLYYRDDETGNAYQFCLSLAECLRSQGVEFRFRAVVTSLETHLGEVTAVNVENARLTADRYVVAAGSYCTSLLQPAGIRLPVRPVKGYSVTFERLPAPDSLRIPIIDDHLHAVVVPLGGAIRVAGTAEFTGYDLSLPPARIDNLVRLLPQVLPYERLDLATGKPWCGLRAMSADGVPIVSPTPVRNLFVNTGHGHLGWTMAAGSAELLADLLEGKQPLLDARPYALERFGAVSQARDARAGGR